MTIAADIAAQCNHEPEIALCGACARTIARLAANEALERAAREAEEQGRTWADTDGHTIAAAIRAMKEGE